MALADSKRNCAGVPISTDRELCLVIVRGLLTNGTSQQEDEESQGIAQDRTLKKIRPHETVDYAWDSPAATGKRLRLVADDQERIIDIMEIGVQPPFKFRSAVSAVVCGTTRAGPALTIWSTQR